MIEGIVKNMLLAVDVGNTQTVLGLYEGEELRFTWRIVTNKYDTTDELRIKLSSLLKDDEVSVKNIRGLALASVVPRLTASWMGVSKRMFDKKALVVSARSAEHVFETNYANPDEIGADRVADAVAAVALYGAPVVVVDFGTATNIEIIDKDGIFVGGVIAPGVETSAAALFSHAARLGDIELVDPHTAIGQNTSEAVQAGIVYGEAERVDGLVRRIFEQLGYDAPVIGTGGLALAVASSSRSITEVNTELTLEGLRLIYASRPK